jgi:hypothetical protein
MYTTAGKQQKAAFSRLVAVCNRAFAAGDRVGRDGRFSRAGGRDMMAGPATAGGQK